MIARLSLRARLTVVYGLVVAAMFVLFGLLLYVVLYGALLQDIDQTLTWRTQQVKATLWPSSGGSLTPADLPSAKLDLSPLESLAAPGLYVRVFDAQGALIGVSDNLKNGWLPTRPENIGKALRGSTVTAEAGAGGHRLRLRTTPIITNRHVSGVLQVGESLQPLNDTMTRVKYILLGLSAAALALSVTAGWWIAKRGLRPLRRIAQMATEIRASGDFSRRLERPAPQDEIGELAGAFNAVLGKADETLLRHRQFVAACSHELRTPLLIVRGNLDLIARLDDPAERDECVAEARAEAARMQHLVADLLLLAQVERGQVVEQRPVRLDELLREVYRQLAPRAANHRFTLDVAGPRIVLGDRERLKQVVVNLVENALVYTPEGGSVALGLERRVELAVLSVRDTGIGILPQEQERIFEPFYRVDRARERNHGGAGLGLSIVRYLVEAHDGTIAVESRPGEGSTFRVSLPLVWPESAEPADAAGMPPRVAVSA